MDAALLAALPERLYAFWERYRACFRTKTRDTSPYAYHYLSGQLRMETNRTFTQIGRVAGVAGENIQHFMSNAPWDAQAVFRQIQAELAATPTLTHDGLLILDESADQKAGPASAGAARQWNGRLGKIALSQVGVMLAFAHGGRLWTWIDGELFLPEAWFTPDFAAARARTGIPPTRRFATKVELGWQMVERVLAQGLPCPALACDALYGRAHWFRAALDRVGVTYSADIPNDLEVFLHPDATEEPATPGRGRGKGRRARAAGALLVREVAHRSDTQWQTVTVRTSERGMVCDRFAARQVWTRRDGAASRTAEWLVLRETADGIHYSLSNATAATPVDQLARASCQRYAIECSNREAKTDLGWDELQAQRYGAWEHHLALTALASWFIAQTKLTWQTHAPPDTTLCAALGVDVLPPLSMTNIRMLLRAALPLPQWTIEEAARLVADQLLARARSRKSRLRHQGIPPPD